MLKTKEQPVLREIQWRKRPNRTHSAAGSSQGSQFSESWNIFFFISVWHFLWTPTLQLMKSARESQDYELSCCCLNCVLFWKITFLVDFYFAHVFPPVYGIRQRGQVDLRLENGPGAVALAEEFSVEFHWFQKRKYAIQISNEGLFLKKSNRREWWRHRGGIFTPCVRREPFPLAKLLLLPPSAFNWNQFKGGSRCSFWFQ